MLEFDAFLLCSSAKNVLFSHLVLKTASDLQKSAECCSRSPNFLTPVAVFYLINCIIS